MICDDCQKQDGCQYLPMVLDGDDCQKEEICSSFFPKQELPIICRSCQAQFDGSCKYVGNPIRHVSSPEHFCTTHNSAAIADSGQRTSFPTGAVRDMHEGKVEKVNCISFSISEPGHYCIQIKENEGWALLKKV